MATVASIVTVVMGFSGAMLLFNAIVKPSRCKSRELSQALDRNAYRDWQRTMRIFGLTAASLAVIAAYIAALAG